jgi:hypothetical protein
MQGTKEEPTYMKLIPSDDLPPLKNVLILTGLSLLPLALGILMQKPALREALRMRCLHYGSEVCWWVSNTTRKGAAALDNQYFAARL